MQKLRLLIADDHDLVRKGVRAYLEERQGWEVVAEAASGREAVEKAKLVRPDVTILDLRMPDLNGLEATREILKAVPTKVLIFTIYDSDQLIQESLKAGARGYVLKSDPGQTLLLAVEALRRNKTFLASEIAEKVLDVYLQPQPGQSRKNIHRNRSPLTARQKEILHLIANGKTNQDVATALNISLKTVETHRADLMRRLEYHSVADVVRYAIRNEITAPNLTSELKGKSVVSENGLAFE